MKLAVKESKIHGKGLFADGKINRGEVILIFKGKVVDTDDLSDNFIMERH